MYHSFPRRWTGEQGNKRALQILGMIFEYGLLLTPEIETWQDRKGPPGCSENYYVVSKRCCFTEISDLELGRHSIYFGSFALEFDTKMLADMGAVPVFYIPRTSDSDGYGVGAAILTQLAHVQELLNRIATFASLASQLATLDPLTVLWAWKSETGDLLLGKPGGQVVNIPAELIAKTAKGNSSFSFEPPSVATPFGMNAGGLLNLCNILSWGNHDLQTLTGAVKGLGSLFYSTERLGDPFLEHYRQREWRIIGGLLKNNVPVSEPLSSELRKRLVQMDPDFFERTMSFPTGRATLLDKCEILNQTIVGKPVRSLVRRVVVPSSALVDAQAVLRGIADVEIVASETLSE